MWFLVSAPGALLREIKDPDIPATYYEPDMPQFYLHIRNCPEGKYLDVDPDGMNLPNLDAARALAVKMAQELWADWSEVDRDTVIEIANEAGQSLLSVPFSEAMGSKQ